MHESSEEFEFLPDPTTDCGVSCHCACEKNPNRIIMGKTVLPLFLGYYFILAGNDDIHESLDEFESWPVRLLVSMATDRVIVEKTVLPLFLGYFLSDPFHTCRY